MHQQLARGLPVNWKSGQTGEKVLNGITLLGNAKWSHIY